MSDQAEQSEISPQQATDETLVISLARGFTANQAAVSAGCSPRTVSRRLADPAFQARIQDARAEMLDSALGRLLSAAADAVLTLHGLAKPINNNAPDKVKISAAKTVLDSFIKIKDVADLELRLAAIEKKLAKRGGK